MVGDDTAAATMSSSTIAAAMITTATEHGSGTTNIVNDADGGHLLLRKLFNPRYTKGYDGERGRQAGKAQKHAIIHHNIFERNC